MIKPNYLPLLPGLSFDRKIGCEKWHKSPKFDWLNGKVPFMVESKRPNAEEYPLYGACCGGRYESLFPLKENGELPSWIIHDKQILSFDAFFEESNPKQIRTVKILYFLEDGTIQVNEKKNDTSGSQGTLISRRRIPFPRPIEKAVYEIIDLNIGLNVDMYGRSFFIFDCDKFTRQYLNRNGIPVQDAITIPELDFNKAKNAGTNAKKNIPKKVDKLGQFLKYDGHVLRFYGYWDDRDFEGGYLHNLIIQYYLSDDTMDVREKGGDFMLARSRLPKQPLESKAPGTTNSQTILNVLSTGYLKGRIAKDAQNVGGLSIEYYTDADLLPGVCINIYGRPVIITGSDAFTKEFYKAKYGVDHFNEMSVPIPEKDHIYDKPKLCKVERELPPWNGFGSFEDSEGNCISFVPKQSGIHSAQKLVKARSGLDSHILRFKARMVVESCRASLDKERLFIISYYLSDDTTSIYETAERNSGYEQRMFVARKEAFKPTPTLLVPRKPSTYTKEDFWVGNILEVDKYKFELLEADEYCLKYMETNSQEFPKSNIQIILEKIRNKIRPIYKSFVRDHLLKDGEQIIPKQRLIEALQTLMGSEITCHEIITVYRSFALSQPTNIFDKDTLRDVCRNECRRLLFHGYKRLSESLYQKDLEGLGYLPRKLAYSMCRGARIPIEPDFLNYILDCVDQNEKGDVSISDLLTFFDIDKNIPTYIPFNHVLAFCEYSKLRNAKGILDGVDCLRLIEALGLEEELKKES